VTLALVVLAALFSLATALASVLGRREAAQEARELREQVATLTRRLQEAERAAERAVAASRLLHDRGIAGEGEPEGFREAERAQAAPSPRGGSRTVH